MTTPDQKREALDNMPDTIYVSFSDTTGKGYAHLDSGKNRTKYTLSPTDEVTVENMAVMLCDLNLMNVDPDDWQGAVAAWLQGRFPNGLKIKPEAE